MALEVQGAVATIRIPGQPDGNALTPENCRELHEMLCEVELDAAVRSVVLTGSPEHFCSGFDAVSLIAMRRRSREDIVDEAFGVGAPCEPTYLSIFPTLFGGRLSKPAVAAIRGNCLGLGLAIVGLHTDMRVASSDAVFGFPDTRTGFAGGIAHVSQLVWQMPAVHFNWLVETASTVTAERAHEMQLINEVVSPDRVLARAHELAERMAARWPAARDMKAARWPDVGMAVHGWTMA